MDVKAERGGRKKEETNWSPSSKWVWSTSSGKVGTAWTSRTSFLRVVPGVYNDTTTPSSGAVSSFRIRDTSAAIHAHLSTKCAHPLGHPPTPCSKPPFQAEHLPLQGGLWRGLEQATTRKVCEGFAISWIWWWQRGMGWNRPVLIRPLPIPSNVVGYEPWTSPFPLSSTLYPH